MSQFHWPITKKQIKVGTMEAPKLEDSIERRIALPFGPPI
jgi:hypothetical protein